MLLCVVICCDAAWCVVFCRDILRHVVVLCCGVMYDMVVYHIMLLCVVAWWCV